MNTPAHLAASLLAWPKETRWRDACGVAFGTILPDISMFFFYGYQKVIGRSEKEIWGTLYFEDHWQYFFDVFNSIPIAILVFIIFRFFGYRLPQLIAASAGLHMLCDLPVHHDDGHRHFLPISNWRFESPVSYWDPEHFGIPFAILELVFAVIALVWVQRNGQKPMRRFAMGTLIIYAVAIVLLIFWLLSRLVSNPA